MKENAFSSRVKFDHVPILFFFTYFAASFFWLKTPLAILLLTGLAIELIMSYFIYLRRENPVRFRQGAHALMLLIYWSFGILELKSLFPAAPGSIALFSYILPGGVIVWGYTNNPVKKLRFGKRTLVVDSFATQLAVGGLLLALAGILKLYFNGMNLLSIAILVYGTTTFMIGKDYFQMTWRRFWVLNKTSWLAVLGALYYWLPYLSN